MRRAPLPTAAGWRSRTTARATTSSSCARPWPRDAHMKIGKATRARTAISTSNAERIVVRGADLCDELIGQLSFGDYFWFLLTGERPPAAASAVLNATLVAIAEHGLVPSMQAARMTLAAAPDAMQGAVAAGVLGSGSVILGASETAGRLLDAIDRAAGPDRDP